MHRLLQGLGPDDATPAGISAFNLAHRSALLASEVAVGLALLAAASAPLYWVQRACHRAQREQEGVMDTQSLLAFILLPLLVLATVITFLLIQRARRKRDLGH